MRRLGVLLGTVAVVLAGCGGGNGPTAALDVSRFEACLAKSDPGLQTNDTDGLDLVARTATDGAVQVLTPSNNEVQVVGSESSGQADEVVKGYEVFGLGTVEKKGTVVLAYTRPPADSESGPINSCLENQGIS